MTALQRLLGAYAEHVAMDEVWRAAQAEMEALRTIEYSGEFRVGTRVMYKYGERGCGTIVKAFRGMGGGWYVRWDHVPSGSNAMQAAECNLQIIGEKETR